MSGEPKTHTLTLEEALQRIAANGRDQARMEPTGLGRWVVSFGGHNPVIHDTWERAASDALGVPVVARDEAAEDCFCDKCGWAGKATSPDYRHDGCGYGALPVREWKLYAAKKEAAELLAAVREYLAALDAWATEPYPAHAERHHERKVAAEANLRRLAGGEAS